MQFGKHEANTGAVPLPVIASNVMKLTDLFAHRPMTSLNGDGKSLSDASVASNTDSEAFQSARREMVDRQLRKRDIRSPRVLEAMSSVPRHLFVPPEYMDDAYTDSPLPIGAGQTISQPYMVAAMAEALLFEGSEKVLEIGAGSGYQAAVLSMLARVVIAIESQASLAEAARARLTHLGYSNVRVET